MHCRRKRDIPDSEEVLINEKEILAGKKNFDFDMYKLSPNGKHIAYTMYNYYLDENRIYIKNLQNQNHNPTVIINAELDKWINDSSILYYKGDDRVSLFIHKLGTPQSRDKLIFDQEDANFEYKQSVSNSEKYIFFDFVNFAEGSVVYYIDIDKPDELKTFTPFEKGVFYRVYHHTNDTLFYITTNLNAPNFKVVTTSLNNTNSKNWVDFLPDSENVIQWVYSAKGNWLVFDEFSEGSMKLSILDKRTGKRSKMEFDEKLYTLTFLHIDTLKKTMRFMYKSFITPETYYDYNIETNQLTKLFETQISNYNKSDYEMELIYVPAHDGTQIPVALIYNKNTPRDGTAPVYIQANSGGWHIYNIPFFNTRNLTLLDRGFFWVCPHVRGSGPDNSQMEISGIGSNTKNKAHDFASVAKYLINENYTSANKIHAFGLSAGGETIGMVANMYPELFRSITFLVPYLDVIFEKDENYWATAGNPNIKEEFDYMIDYSPYQNIKKQNYPAMLFVTGINDRNVPSYQTIKMAAKIRANNTGTTPIYLSTDLKGNHYIINQKKTLLPFVFILALHNNILPL